MIWLLCLLPPLACFAVGRPGAALLNILLTICFYFPGVVHALFVVGQAQADGRTKSLRKDIQKQTAAIERQTVAQQEAELRALKQQEAALKATK